MVSRSAFIRTLAAASTAWLADGLAGPTLRALARQQNGGTDSPTGDLAARIARVIEEYDRQGIHRTGTDVDNRSATWLMELAKAAGAEARIEPFAVGRVDVRSAHVEIDGRRAEGLPLFDGTFTDASGVAGRIGAPETGSPVALVTTEGAGITTEGRALRQLRESGRHQAIVVVTRGAHAGLTPMNAADFTNPYGCPVLQVSSEEGDWLDAQAKAGRDARVVAHAARVSTHAYNVLAFVTGRRANLPPIIVMTPRSGWWHCASERGGGLACWLEAMRAVSEARPARTVRFIASSGHELGHLGLDAFLGNQPALIKSASAWIHLGANIGAAGGRPRLQSVNDAIEKLALTSLTRAGAEVQQRVPRGTVPAGEARNIHVGGGRYVSLLGSSPVFHSLADRWPDAVDPEAVAGFARAIGDLAVTLANQT